LNRLLNSLSDAGVASIVVDTSTHIGETERAQIHRTADLYIERLNTGWDFASWLSVIASYPWLEQTADRLLLINDSNFGPTYPLRDLLDQPWHGGRTPDVWGLTDSLQHGAHLQSYFLVLEQRAVRAALLSNFASRFTFPVDKGSIIIEGEVGLTKLARQMGLDVAARFPYSHVIEQFEREFDARLQALSSKDPATSFRLEHGLLATSYPLGFLLATRDDIQNGVALNPTHHFWDVLLRLGSPFIKRELAIRNPVPIPLLRSSLRDLVPDTVYQEMLSELHPLDNCRVGADVSD
jgi:hypothetical protein